MAYGLLGVVTQTNKKKNNSFVVNDIEKSKHMLLHVTCLLQNIKHILRFVTFLKQEITTHVILRKISHSEDTRGGYI